MEVNFQFFLAKLDCIVTFTDWNFVIILAWNFLNLDGRAFAHLRTLIDNYAASNWDGCSHILKNSSFVFIRFSCLLHLFDEKTFLQLLFGIKFWQSKARFLSSKQPFWKRNTIFAKKMVICQFIWWKKHRLGRVFCCNTFLG